LIVNIQMDQLKKYLVIKEKERQVFLYLKIQLLQKILRNCKEANLLLKKLN